MYLQGRFSRMSSQPCTGSTAPHPPWRTNIVAYNTYAITSPSFEAADGTSFCTSPFFNDIMAEQLSGGVDRPEGLPLWWRHIASHSFRQFETRGSNTRKYQNSSNVTRYMNQFISPEDGKSMFIRNISSRVTDYGVISQAATVRM
jgi:hypothetical protein